MGKDEMNFKGKIGGNFEVDKSIKGSKIEKDSNQEDVLNVEQDVAGDVKINKSITDSEIRSKWGWVILAIITAIVAIAAYYYNQ